jgi:hypothetical protein
MATQNPEMMEVLFKLGTPRTERWFSMNAQKVLAVLYYCDGKFVIEHSLSCDYKDEKSIVVDDNLSVRYGVHRRVVAAGSRETLGYELPKKGIEGAGEDEVISMMDVRMEFLLQGQVSNAGEDSRKHEYSVVVWSYSPDGVVEPFVKNDFTEKPNPFVSCVVWDSDKGDSVNHPPHYKQGKYEVIDILQEFFPKNPLLWQVGKYIMRAGKKGGKEKYVEDLKKAAWYLNREIMNAEGAKNNEGS